MLKFRDIAIEATERIVEIHSTTSWYWFETFKFLPKNEPELSGYLGKRIQMPDGRIGKIRVITLEWPYAIDILEGLDERHQQAVVEMTIEFTVMESFKDSLTQIARAFYDTVNRFAA